LLQLSKLARGVLSDLTTPFIVHVGEKDVVSVAKTQAQLLDASAPAQRFKVVLSVTSGWHDLLHGRECDTVLENMVLWANERCRVLGLIDSLD
jgi:hypothetical protein